MLDVKGGNYWKSWERFVQKKLVKGAFISAEDQSLYLVTDDLEKACNEIRGFYSRYHSSRFVERRQTLVLRLHDELSDRRVAELTAEFRDILSRGEIEKCQAFPEEEDEPELRMLPRLSLAFDQLRYGRLRQLINAINR
jgi:hypothetical protein